MFRLARNAGLGFRFTGQTLPRGGVAQAVAEMGAPWTLEDM